MPAVGPVWNVDWLNANSQRNYPISEEATLKDLSGSFTLPKDFIVDLLLPVHSDASIDPTKFHIHSIGIFGTGVSITFGYDGDAIGSVSIDASTFTGNQSFVFEGTGAFFDTIGKVIIGTLDTIMNFAGAYEFDIEGARIEPHAIVPDLRGVSAIYLKNGDDTIGPLTGDIVFQAGRNCLMNYVNGPAGEPDRLLLNAISGEGLTEDCACSEAANRPCIETINGISPDENGDFTLLGDECLLLNTIANGLQLVDQCANPCCGCAELEVVETHMQRLIESIFRLEAQASKLETAVITMENVILASKTETQT